MNFNNRVCQKLHEEHAAVIALLERLTQTIARHRDDAPAAKDPMVAKLLSDLAAELPGEVERHFAFEESELFPYLSTRSSGPSALRWSSLSATSARKVSILRAGANFVVSDSN